MIKLNLGCWKRNFPGWINIDVIGYPHVHFKRDIKDLSIFDDNAVDLVYASHSLEYFTLDEAREALREWCRVLKPGGELRVCVPDFAALVQVYLKHKDPLMLRGSIFAITDKVLEKEGKLIFHKMIYDEKLLGNLLRECGFTDVKRYDWKEFLAQHLPEGITDRSAGYLPPLHEDKNGVLVSLNLVATKADPLRALAQKAFSAANQVTNKIVKKVERVFRGGETKKKDPYKV